MRQWRHTRRLTPSTTEPHEPRPYARLGEDDRCETCRDIIVEQVLQTDLEGGFAVFDPPRPDPDPADFASEDEYQLADLEARRAAYEVPTGVDFVDGADEDQCTCGHLGHVGRCEGTSDALDPMLGLPPGQACVCEGTLWKITKPMDVSIVVRAATHADALEVTDGLWGLVEGDIADELRDDVDEPADEEFVTRDPRVKEIFASGFFDDISVEVVAP